MYTHTSYLVTERADEGEKGENLDDMYDLMVREVLGVPTNLTQISCPV